MSLDYINEAFKKLELLSEETFDTSLNGINQLSDFMDNDDAEDIVRVIDDEATSEEEIKDSYIGKVIVNCNVCHSHVFKNKDDIEIDTDGIVNGEEQCPYCGEQEGFSVVGEIAPFAPQEETPAEDNGQEVEVDDTAVELEEDFTSEFIPKLTEKLKSKGIDTNLITVAPAKFGNFKIDFDDTTINSTELVNKTKEAITELGYIASVEFNGEAVEILKLEIKSKELEEDFKNVSDIFDHVKYKLCISTPEDGYDTGIIERRVKNTPLWSAEEASAWAKGLVDKELDYLRHDITHVWVEAAILYDENAPYKMRFIVGNIDPKYIDSAINYDPDHQFKEYWASHTSDEQLSQGWWNTDNLTEDFKNVSITTDDQHMEMTSDENGKVTVSTEPVTTMESTDEVIVPVSDETQMDIEANNAETIEDTEEPAFEDEFSDNSEDIDFDEIDEESLDELGEEYLKRVYENVDSYRTTDIHATPTQLIVEGTLKFNSGVEKKTGFIFEAKDVNSKGSLRFTGFNKHLTESKDAYTLIGSVKDKKLFVESFKYNYTVGDAPVRGVVRKSR